MPSGSIRVGRLRFGNFSLQTNDAQEFQIMNGCEEMMGFVGSDSSCPSSSSQLNAAAIEKIVEDKLLAMGASTEGELLIEKNESDELVVVDASGNVLTTLGDAQSFILNAEFDSALSLRADYNTKVSAKAETPTIKMSSLSYANSALRVGFDFNTHFNDFNNEGHMYPVHGVGDIDKTTELMAKFVKSAQGDAFGITDLGINIKVIDQDLITPNCFFDFHTIPTKHLDGSAKLPDGTRVEQHIPYFNPKATTDFEAKDIMSIDWISGNAKFTDANNSFGFPTDKEFPTTLTSTRVTPQMDQGEYFGLTFFMDGKQARVTNGGAVSNWRYVSPGYDVDIAWFVAKAMVPCSSDVSGAELCTTTDGAQVWARPRTATETENLETISYNQNRIMKTVSKPVIVKNAADKFQSFNQRYGDKEADFGDLIIPDVLGPDPLLSDVSNNVNWANVDAPYQKWVAGQMPHMAEKQIAFYEMLKVLVADPGMAALPGPYQHVSETSDVGKVLAAFKARYLRADTYNISLTALATKAQKPPSYMPTPIGETGWMVVPEDAELTVPDDDGEYFIGWSILNQPQNRDVTDTENPTNGCKEAVIRWAQTHGYALHQGPGIIYLTGGDFAHGGTQEPYILAHNYPPEKRNDNVYQETDDQLIAREKAQLPSVHWRLDRQEVILKSLEMGACTQANVGAGQKMLASIGTKTPLNKPSRSANFLGRYYQNLLADPALIQNLIDNPPTGSQHVYEIDSVDPNTFTYGVNQQTTPSTY